MEKYGFDYFIKRTQQINEMAKPNEFAKMGASNPAFLNFNKNVYLPLLSKMSEVGQLDKTKAAQKSIMYLTTLLADLGEHANAYRDFVNKYVSDHVDSYQKWLGSKKDNTFQQTQFVLVQMVKQNIDKFTDPNFVNTIFDEDNIREYANTNRISKISNYSQGRAKETENVFNMSIEDLDKLRALAAPIVKKINIAKGGRQHSITRLGDASKFSKKGVDKNSPVGIATIVRDALEELLDSKRDIISRIQQGSQPTDSESIILSKFPEEEIIKLLQTFDRRIDDGKGIALDQVYSKIIDPLQNHPNQYVSGFGDLLDFSVESALEDGDGGVEADYGSYDNDLIYSLLDSGKITEEELEILKQWIPVAAKYKELKQMRQDSKDVSGAANKFLKKSEEEAEEGIMGYMTEQVTRDKHHNPKGKFVDRGFKKCVNYNHWMQINS